MKRGKVLAVSLHVKTATGAAYGGVASISIDNGTAILTGSESPAQSAPITASGGPGVSLVVDAGSEGETRIDCRRVVTLIGSREGCKIRLCRSGISPVHVAIVNDGSHVLAVDLVTKGGTRLNGLKMEHERLSDGDLLSIRPWEFHVAIREPSHGGDADVHTFGLDPTPHAVALEHLDTGRILKPNRDLCVVGRRNGCDVVISDDRVSRVHALLLSYFGHPAIFDLLSRNGTLVNGEAISFHRLENNDVITVGESRFRVRLVGSAVVERASGNGKAAKSPITVVPEEIPGDEIDIAETESSQSWRIADELAKAFSSQ